jgi:hypothetical protein
MSKRKRARTGKARSSSKVRAKAARSRIAGHHQTRANSKQARVLGLLSRHRESLTFLDGLARHDILDIQRRAADCEIGDHPS